MPDPSPAAAPHTATLLVPAATATALSPTASAAPPTATTPADLPPPEAGLPAGQAAVVAAAAADLAERLSVDASGIELVIIFGDDLPASDLGCPRKGAPDPVQPGFVTGWVIQLRAAGGVHEYRAHGSQVVYCGALPPPPAA